MDQEAPSGEDGVRVPGAEEEASEDAFSSFSDTESEGDELADRPEEAPILHPVAAPPPPPPGAPVAPLRDVAWRNYRRTLEWRCRWVELRMAELAEQEAHYADLEARLLAAEAAGPSAAADGAAAAADAAPGEPARSPSPRADEAGAPTCQAQPPPAAAPRLRHARVWRRRQRRAPPAPLGCFPGSLESALSAPPPPLRLLGRAGEEESDSDLGADALFDSAVVLQGRVTALFGQLAAQRAQAGLPPAPARRTTVRLATAAGVGLARAGAVAGARPTPEAASAQRRDRERAADFDISDVVGASGGPKAIERAPHVDIATPGVRRARLEPWETMADSRAAAAALAAAAAAMAAARAEAARAREEGAPAGSSSEETDDEAFAALHAPMEVLEKKLRLGPAPGRGSGAVGRGQVQPPPAPPDELAAAAAAGQEEADDAPFSPSLLSPGGAGGAGGGTGTDWSARVHGNTARFVRGLA